ncbi:hypothetical protein [Leucobacter celer]|uniref:hypothetical protein n=1 Tax=Leucobacter celer TaxID=668625 RepID=UPI0006A78E4B|nr:hypothetical protein [Leucobacter celer]
MGEVEKFSVWRQRTILTDIADSGGEVLKSAEGFAFIEQLHEFFASSMVSIAKSWGYAADSDEVVNLIIERLLSTRTDPEKCPARYAAVAEEPWAYLWTCTLRWGQEMWGTRGVPLEYAEAMPAGGGEDETEYTPLGEVVDLTFAVVSQVIDVRHHAAVLELLSWVAANPPQRLSYDLDDRVAAHRHCPSLSVPQVIAVMKIARGSRPNTRATSLMGQFLINPVFRVSESGSHARALTHFKNAFRAGEAGSKQLTDWIS